MLELTSSNSTLSNYTAPAPTSSAIPSATSGANAGAARLPPGPPYPPSTAQLGGIPTKDLDMPICIVLILLFAAGAAFNMTRFLINRRRGYKFVFSMLLFGFCMARITTLTVRAAWSTHTDNVNVGIVAGILTAAGVLLLFIINLLFAQRILRAYHPFFGWCKPVNVAFMSLFVSVVAVLAMVITATVQQFFTLDEDTRARDHIIQKFAATYMAMLAFLPTPIVLIAAVAPRSTPVEKFGQGTFRAKVVLLVMTSLLLSLGAGFRAGIAYEPRPLQNPAWFQSKACYYMFNFFLELVVVYTYALSRFDKRFHVPDGSCAPGHYAGGVVLGTSSQQHVSTYHFASQQSTLLSNGKRTSNYPSSVRSGRPYQAPGLRVPSMSSHVDPDLASNSHDQEWMERAMRELHGDQRNR